MFNGSIKNHTVILSTLIVIVFLETASAQSRGDVSWALRSGRKYEADTSQKPTRTVVPASPLQFMSGAISLYQLFISSQDLPMCMFEPSCSHYGQSAIKEHGLLIGALATADRFLRCNSLTAREYPLNPKTGKFVDPP